MTAEQISTFAEAITAGVAVLSVLIAALVTGIEHLRWKREYSLQEKKWSEELKLQERKWAEDINNKIELELLKVRLSDYPRIIKALKPLSKHTQQNLKKETTQEIGSILNDELYNPVVVSMRGDTRLALGNLRDACWLYAQDRLPIEELSRARTYFLSTLFRDLGMLGDWNPEIPSLVKTMKEMLESISRK